MFDALLHLCYLFLVDFDLFCQVHDLFGLAAKLYVMLLANVVRALLMALKLIFKLDHFGLRLG